MEKIVKNFWTRANRPFLALAPMAGITDQPFRLICKDYGVDVLYSEMVSSGAIFHNANSNKIRFGYTSEVKEVLRLGGVFNKLYKTLELIKFSKKERPYVVQIFGADPEHMAYAAEYISSGQWARDLTQSLKFKTQNHNSKFKTEKIPDGIDINFGCPAKDVTKTGAGAALLKNPKLAEKIIKAIKKKVKGIPISVKTRIGWNNNKYILTFLRMLECIGVDAIAIHGRTAKQGFSGKVDWETIYKVKKELKIPVIGNGNITINSQLTTKQQKLDGIMIGQGALGKPWVFRNLKSKISNLKTNASLRDDYNDIKTIKKIALKHAKLVEKLKGQQGIIEFRKHLGWYFRGRPNAKKIRTQLTKINSLNDVKKLLNKIS